MAPFFLRIRCFPSSWRRKNPAPVPETGFVLPPRKAPGSREGDSNSFYFYTIKGAEHQPLAPRAFRPPPQSPRQGVQRESEHHWQKWQSGQGCFFFRFAPSGQKNRPCGVTSKRFSPWKMNFLFLGIPFPPAFTLTLPFSFPIPISRRGEKQAREFSYSTKRRPYRFISSW